jgi:predicted dehydrogenase
MINLEVIDLVRRGRIGEPKFFNSSFAMTVRQGDIRTKRTLGGGSVYDIGVYCINAARYIFRAEPREVLALSVNSGAARVKEIDESTGALLRFEGDRLAAFVTSFNAADIGHYEIVGTKGHIRVNPAYEYAEGLGYEMTIDGKPVKKKGMKLDQFAAELLYFSDCIVKNRQPEPSGEEGLQDVRIVEAIYRSARTGRSVAIPRMRKPTRPSGRQKIAKPGLPRPKVFKVKAPSGG